MKILLLGATGRTGKQVLRYAMEKGHTVHCLVRNPEKIIQQKNVKIFKGNPANLDDLHHALKACDAIISVLNISRTTDFPWSPLRTPKKYLSEVMGKLVTVADVVMVKRVVICSAWGVGDSKKEIPFWFRWLIDFSNIKYAYRDHERQENILQNTTLPWTIVRPSGLTNTDRSQNVSESFSGLPTPGLTISRKTVARYMVDALEDDSLLGKTVAISKD